MARRRQPRRARQRVEGTRDLRKRILCVTEGETEKSYLDGFSAAAHEFVVVVSKARGTDPKSVVQSAISRAEKTANDRFEKFDHVWAVYDRDSDPESALKEAEHLAKTNSISIAFSNPSFELWLLLHFRDKPGQLEREKVLRMLRDKRHLPSYTKGQQDFVRDFADGYSDAVERAKKLHDDEAYANIKNVDRNPFTTVHLLTEQIKS